MNFGVSIEIELVSLTIWNCQFLWLWTGIKIHGKCHHNKFIFSTQFLIFCTLIEMARKKYFISRASTISNLNWLTHEHLIRTEKSRELFPLNIFFFMTLKCICERERGRRRANRTNKHKTKFTVLMNTLQIEMVLRACSKEWNAFVWVAIKQNWCVDHNGCRQPEMIF